MTALTTRHARQFAIPSPHRRTRPGAKERPRSLSDTTVLGRWIAEKASRYNDLLANIAAAPKPVPRKSR